MSDDKWIHLGQSRPGYPDSRAQLKEIPAGPFVLVPQNTATLFEKNYAVMDFAEHRLIKVDKFELRWGYITYAVGPDFAPMRVGEHIDSSD
jgi:hypothetical protein